jgi:hypothetical protein
MFSYAKSLIFKMLNARFVVFFIGTSLFFFCQSCRDDNAKKNIPDVSDVQISLKVERFDQALAKIDTNNVEATVTALEQQFPDFTKTYFERVIGVKDPRDSVGLYRRDVRRFLTEPTMRLMLDTIGKVFNNFDREKSEIEQGLRFYKHYFPNANVPTTVYTMPSAYNYAAVFPSDSSVAIGLDMFLGADHSAYDMLAQTTYPRFISRTFRRDYLVDRVFELLVSDKVGNNEGNRLIDHMIHNGKKLYILDCLIPNTADSIKLNYTTEQMKSTIENEGFAWGRILKENLLYSTRYQDFQKLVTPSPNAPIIAAEAPGGVGNFLGWQIVKSYMKRNPNASLTDLINEKDAQKILDLAKYKPALK